MKEVPFESWPDRRAHSICIFGFFMKRTFVEEHIQSDQVPAANDAFFEAAKMAMIREGVERSGLFLVAASIPRLSVWVLLAFYASL